MIRLRVSPAQHSALECREGGGLDPLTEAAWQAPHLVFAEADSEGLWSELNDASNAEGFDAEALRRLGENLSATLAGRASRSLCALAGRVLRS